MRHIYPLVIRSMPTLHRIICLGKDLSTLSLTFHNSTSNNGLRHVGRSQSRFSQNNGENRLCHRLVDHLGNQ